MGDSHRPIGKPDHNLPPPLGQCHKRGKFHKIQRTRGLLNHDTPPGWSDSPNVTAPSSGVNTAQVSFTQISLKTAFIRVV